jgi:DNA modification methylase
MPESDYQQFLEAKICLDRGHGFSVDPDNIRPLAAPDEWKHHQVDVIRWACRGGRRAIFASFGLGKSLMQLEILRQVGEREGGRQLIVCPLGVRQEFKIDARKLGLSPKFVRFSDQAASDGLYLTNYESIRDGRLDPNLFNAVSLDEASVLRSFGSKTYQEFLTLFDSLKYRFVATATPSPNRYKELIHYAGFLGIMDTGQALTRFFQRDSSKANKLTIYPHKEKEFWLWVSSWAIFLQKPSDLGYSDEGYDLPPLHVHWHCVKTEPKQVTERDGQVRMYSDAAMSLRDAAREKRDSLDLRIEKMVDILDDDTDHFIIWHDLEAERHAIGRALPEAVEVYGSLDLDERENRIIGFSNGEFQYLATKPILSGSGCNFQRHCHKSIFLGVGFKFNDFIQAIHRIYRFLQDRECHVHIIHADTEFQIVDELKRKWRDHDRLVGRMTEIIKKYGLSHRDMFEELTRSIGVERIQADGEFFTAVNNDCVIECQGMDDNCVDLIHTSIPFSNHYEYTPSFNDFGHTEGNGHFWEQMDFLTPELFRILRPGRVYACHVKDRILFGNVTNKGVPTVSPFHAEAIFHNVRHGFDYLGMITVVTDVVRENNQTYRLGWSEQCKDGTKMGVGSPEYILLFRKPQTDRTRGYADVPVVKDKQKYSRSRWQVDAHAFWRSSGERFLTADEIGQYDPDTIVRVFEKHSLENIYDYESHVILGERLDVKGALPATFMLLAPASHHDAVWHDVNRMRTLNGEQVRRNLTMHICPLQFDIVDRILTRYSNEGETVFDPFAGLMTVPYRAVLMGRFGIGCELNHEYFLDGVRYLEAAEAQRTMPTLFDFETEAA